MFNHKKNEVKYLIGDKKINNEQMVPYEEIICNFIEKFSTEILNDKRCKNYPDINTLAFWCRKKNILKFKKKFST